MYTATFMKAAGGLYSTTTDMMKFLKANLCVSGTPTTICNAVALTHKSHFKVGPYMTQGLAWATFSPPGKPSFLGKDGGRNAPDHAGFSSFIAIIPNDQIGIVILSNKDTPPRAIHYVAAHILFGLVSSQE